MDINKHTKYCQKLFKAFNRRHIRCICDDSNNRLNKKIRDAQVKKVPYQIVIGDKEMASKEVSYREYGKQENISISLNNFFKLIRNRIKEKS